LGSPDFTLMQIKVRAAPKLPLNISLPPSLVNLSTWPVSHTNNQFDAIYENL